MKLIKPCPFCGEKPKELYDTSEWWPKDKKEYTVKCANKNCLIFPSTMGYEDRKQAIRAWNRRPR